MLLFYYHWSNNDISTFMLHLNASPLPQKTDNTRRNSIARINTCNNNFKYKHLFFGIAFVAMWGYTTTNDGSGFSVKSNSSQ